MAPFAERHGLKLLPLHGSLSFEAQKAAVAPSEQPKVLLSTNVAESSVTIDGVCAVIDSGLGREAGQPQSQCAGQRDEILHVVLHRGFQVGRGEKGMKLIRSVQTA